MYGRSAGASIGYILWFVFLIICHWITRWVVYWCAREWGAKWAQPPPADEPWKRLEPEPDWVGGLTMFLSIYESWAIVIAIGTYFS